MTEEVDKEYQERNLRKGRYIGQRVWRHRSGEKVSPYHKWVQVLPSDLEDIAEETGWYISKGPEYEEDSQWGAYFFTLERE